MAIVMKTRESARKALEEALGMDNKRLIDNIFDEDFDRDWAFYAKQGKADPVVEEVVCREMPKGSKEYLAIKEKVDKRLGILNGQRGCTHPYIIKGISNMLMLDYYAMDGKNKNMCNVVGKHRKEVYSKSKYYQKLQSKFWKIIGYINEGKVALAVTELIAMPENEIILMKLILDAKIKQLELKFNGRFSDQEMQSVADGIILQGEQYFESTISEDKQLPGFGNALKENLMSIIFNVLAGLWAKEYWADNEEGYESIEEYLDDDMYLNELSGAQYSLANDFFDSGLHIRKLTMKEKTDLYMIYKYVDSFCAMVDYLVSVGCVSDEEGGILCIILEAYGGWGGYDEKLLQALDVTGLWKRWDLRYNSKSQE